MADVGAFKFVPFNGGTGSKSDFRIYISPGYFTYDTAVLFF